MEKIKKNKKVIPLCSFRNC